LREQTAHLLAALLSESVKALAAQLQQLVALGVAQLYCCAEAFGYAAHRVVGASLVAGDAVAGENLAHHPLDAFG
jgi:alkylhydroperoxidase family enzyme